MGLHSLKIFEKYCIKCGLEINRNSLLEERAAALSLTEVEREELHNDFISMQRAERESCKELKIANISPEVSGVGKLL